MAPEEFFTGTTQAGRTLVLYSEHTAYDTFADETGEVVHNPAETQITATLDGAPISVQTLHWSRGIATVRSGDLGTFTATTTDYAEDHTEGLRCYLERRPSNGWQVSILDKRYEGNELVYVVSITNARLTERAEFRFSEQVARKVSKGEPPPSNEKAAAEIADAIRRDTWDQIKHRADNPTTLMWRAH